MALHTPLPLEDARRIGALYGLEVEGAQGILAGSVNSNYALRIASGGRVFLRVYEEQGREAAAREAGLLEHLRAGGVPTPAPLRRRDAGASAAGMSLAEHAGKPVALFPWVDGDALCQAAVTPDVARRVGAALARVHLAGGSFEGAAVSRFHLGGLAARLAGVDRAGLTAELARDVADLEQRLARIRSDAARLGPPPPALIHGDLFRDNVLWGPAGEIAALLDFESASLGSAAFDVMVTVLAWCFGDDLDEELAGALSGGYASVRALSSEERGRLFHEGEVAALRFAITRITDFELRPRGVCVYRDYRRFLARQRALERLGPDGLARVLGL
ncbi:MAG: homoserine kinase [Polyangiaceae bacterium]|nr:homoserine kinase [Polyangiaceae bacterium]